MKQKDNIKIPKKFYIIALKIFDQVIGKESLESANVLQVLGVLFGDMVKSMKKL